jgi:alpha,alpha-trehalase
MQYIKRIILLQTVIICATLLFAQPNKDSIEKVRDYISKNWLGTVENNPIDIGNLYGLPKPYNVPTVHGENLFKELYYWDTYFTNIGLIHDNLLEQAKNNVDDILFMVNRFGKMLNGSNKTYLNRSQPPYLSMMVADIYDKTHDKVWLKNSVATLEKEYQFWMKERLTNCGLNRYSSSASDNEKIMKPTYM